MSGSYCPPPHAKSHSTSQDEEIRLQAVQSDRHGQDPAAQAGPASSCFKQKLEAETPPRQGRPGSQDHG